MFRHLIKTAAEKSGFARAFLSGLFSGKAMLRHLIKVIAAAILIAAIYIAGCAETGLYVAVSPITKENARDMEADVTTGQGTDRDQGGADSDRGGADSDRGGAGRDRGRNRDRDRGRNRNRDRGKWERDQDRDFWGSPKKPKDKFVKHVPWVDKWEYTVSLGKVDIIIVVDNSSSMHKEHTSLARQVGDFLNNIKNVDYHLAVITTDISRSPGNPVRNAYYQDGNFIPIGGEMFLRNRAIGESPSRRDVENFKSALVREETLKCDDEEEEERDSRRSGRSGDQYWQTGEELDAGRGRGNCPSYDERAIYALNLAIANRKYRSFFRKKAPLVVVILSDEDERSGEEYRESNPGYEFHEYDYPETLVQRLSKIHPTKTASFYPIIIPPGDERCLRKQSQSRSGGDGAGRGFYGEEYAKLARARGSLRRYGNLERGAVLSICRKDFDGQLKKVSVKVISPEITLPCAKPWLLELTAGGKRYDKTDEAPGNTRVMRLDIDDPISLNSAIGVYIECPAG